MERHDAYYRQYVQILREELRPATGCTEPIAIAYAAAKARSVLGALPRSGAGGGQRQHHQERQKRGSPPYRRAAGHPGSCGGGHCGRRRRGPAGGALRHDGGAERRHLSLPEGRAGGGTPRRHALYLRHSGDGFSRPGQRSGAPCGPPHQRGIRPEGQSGTAGAGDLRGLRQVSQTAAA